MKTMQSDEELKLEPDAPAGIRESRSGAHPALVVGAADCEARICFWQARAAALEAELAATRTQLLQLARCLPLAMAERLDSKDTALADLAAIDDLLDGWVETTTLWPSGVGAEMSRLWNRLHRNHG